MTADPDARRRNLLLAALGFALVRDAGPGEAVIQALRRWLGSWNGIGRIVSGMARQGYDVSLARYDGLGWRATFYVTGSEHSATAATGSAFETTPFGAVQLAAWRALDRDRHG